MLYIHMDTVNKLTEVLVIIGSSLLSRIICGGVERVHLQLKSGVHSQIWSEMIDILEELWRTDNYTLFLY